MAHLHSIYDTDKHFKINPITRKIISESPKTTLMQYDHNSERFTFEIPRFIEGHDMSISDTVRIHYINIGSTSTDRQSGVYEVDDVQISPDNDDVVIFSWLISRNCTQFNGTLNFAIRFNCVTNEELDYSWGTGIFTGIKVSNGLDNSEVVIDSYVDILEQWKREFLEHTNRCYTELTRTKGGKLRVWVKGGTPGEKYVVIAYTESRKHGHGPKIYGVKSISYNHKLAGTMVYPPEYGVDTMFPYAPYWMQSYLPDIDNGAYGKWEVTISEKYKNGFVDIDLETFLIPFTRPANINGSSVSDWVYSGAAEGSEGHRICYARFVGESTNNIKKNSSLIFRFLVVPYNVFQTASKEEIINYMGNTSSNILKIGSRIRDGFGGDRIKRLDVNIYSYGTNVTSVSIPKSCLYVSII